MNNYIQPGNKIQYTAGGTLASGAIVVIGKRIAILDVALTNGQVGTATLQGVFKLKKATGTAWVQGDKLFYDAGTGELTKTGAGNTPAGSAFSAAASGDAEGEVLLGEVGEAGQMPVQAASVAADTAAMVVDFNALLTKLKNAGLMANS